MSELTNFKEYLGDGVYVEIEGELDNLQDARVKLTTSDGITNTNTIILEHFVYRNLHRWIRQFDIHAEEAT